MLTSSWWTCLTFFKLYFTDFLNELLNSRKKKVDAFKAGRSKAKTVNFEFSDDEDKPTKTKRVSFLKTQRIHSPLEGTSIDGQIENEYSSYSIDGCSSFSSKHSTNVSDQSSDKRSDLGSTHSRDTQESTNRSLSHQLSEDTLQDIPLPLPSDSSIGENSYPVTADRNGTPQQHTTPLKQTAGVLTKVHCISNGMLATVHIIIKVCWTYREGTAYT